MGYKQGAIYTSYGGLEQSKAIEVWQRDGWSLDAGATKSQGFLGVSKDVYKSNKIEIDVGAGITTKKEGYIGAHISF